MTPAVPLSPAVHLLWTLRQSGSSGGTSNPSETTTIIVAVVAVLVLICILFFVGRVLMFRRRTHARAERTNPADNDYLMYAYLQTQSPSVVRMRRLANADGLSVQELNDAAPVKSFAKVADSSDDNICAVCLEEMQPDTKTRKMPCGHEFDARCIEEWVSKANRCPVCNTHVVEEEALQKRRIAAIEGRDPSPHSTRQRRRRARGGNGTYEIHSAGRSNGQQRPQQEEEGDTENSEDAAGATAGASSGASDQRRDGTPVPPGRDALPLRGEAAGVPDQETRHGSSARPTQTVQPAEV